MFRSVRWLTVVALLAGIGLSGCSSSDDPVTFATVSIPNQSDPTPTPGATPLPTPGATPLPGSTPQSTPPPGPPSTPLPGSSPTPDAAPTDPGPDPDPTDPGDPAGAVIILNATVPEQAAGRFQVSVQIPPAQLSTPSFTIPALNPDDLDPQFERTSIELFPGFTSFSADLDSSFTLVEFNQLSIDGVTNANCVIVHESSFDPLVPANQFAVSQGCS